MYYINSELGIALNLGHCQLFKKADRPNTLVGPMGAETMEDRYDIDYHVSGYGDSIRFKSKRERDECWSALMAVIRQHNTAQMTE